MVTREEKIKLIDMINKRIRRAEAKFGFDEETKEKWREQIKDIVSSTDLLTKTGLLSTSKKALDEIDDNEFEMLKNNLPSSIRELESNAKENLEESGISSIIKITKEDIAREVRATIRLSTDFSEAVNEWYGFRDTIDPIYWSDSRIIELENQLYSKGQKSYSELEQWMKLAEQVINDINRRGNNGN